MLEEHGREPQASEHNETDGVQHGAMGNVFGRRRRLIDRIRTSRKAMLGLVAAGSLAIGFIGGGIALHGHHRLNDHAPGRNVALDGSWDYRDAEGRDQEMRTNDEHRVAHRTFDPAQFADRLKEQLSLSDEQYAKVKTLIEQNKAQMEQDQKAVRVLMKSNHDARPDFKALQANPAFQKLRADRDAMNAQITAILTPEQQVRWAEMQQRRGGEAAHDRERPAQK